MFKNFLALISMLALVGPCEAAVFGSAYQKVFNAKIQFSTDGTGVGAGAWRNAILGTDFTATTTSNSNTSADLDGVFASSPIATSLDAFSSYVNSVTGPSVNGLSGGPGENTSFANGALGLVPVGAALSYSLADTRGLPGSLVDLAPATPIAGAGSEVLSSSLISGNQVTSNASTNSSLSAKLSTSIQTLNSGYYRLIADYAINLTTSLTFPADTAFADSVWTLSVSGSNPRITGPNGVTLVPAESVNTSFTPTALNKSVVDGASWIDAGHFDLAPVKLNRGGSYTFTITSSTSTNLYSVPEPASIVMYGLLGVGCLVAGRRVRKS